MRTSEVASKGAQGALFALAGLCFLLPFVSLSCASEEAAEGMELEQGDQTLTGAQLMRGVPKREGVDPSAPLGRPDPDADLEFPIPAEPFAVIAFAAALVGLSFVLRVTRTRLLGASIAGAAGAASLVLLAMSPTLKALGFTAVTLLYGFWVTLGLFVLTAGAHVLQLLSNRNESPDGGPTSSARATGSQSSTLNEASTGRRVTSLKWSSDQSSRSCPTMDCRMSSSVSVTG